jgi:hypothetical protein
LPDEGKKLLEMELTWWFFGWFNVLDILLLLQIEIISISYLLEIIGVFYILIAIWKWLMLIFFFDNIVNRWHSLLCYVKLY